MAMMPELPGYKTLREIGSEGYGRVYLCRNAATGELSALKEIHSHDSTIIDRELAAVVRYRSIRNKVPHAELMPIEHVARTRGGIGYIMPLADGIQGDSPLVASWIPWTLQCEIEERLHAAQWFSIKEILAIILPIASALEALTGQGLVHRDVKPPNILRLEGRICLADPGLLADDHSGISRRGTPGFSAPSWYVESGGHPDLYGLAASLFALLTGQSPDKIGRAAYWWPPHGKD
jgi:eukaryotic-like serine/threonine-protein kinase